MFEIYKRGQGKYTRVLTIIGVMMVVVIGSYILSQKLAATDMNLYIAFGIPTVLVVGLAALMFWLINRPQSADFLIATESEMKKVSWSSRKEIVGSTKVVIITTFILAGLLYGVDAMFVLLFKHLHAIGSGS